MKLILVFLALGGAIVGLNLQIKDDWEPASRAWAFSAIIMTIAAFQKNKK